MHENFLQKKNTANANEYCMRSNHNNRKKEVLCKQKKRHIFVAKKYEKVQGYDYYICVPYICCCYAGLWAAVAVAASPTHTRTEIQPSQRG
jgi:hypothetical protein